jgi:hypothetical protein
MRVFSAEFFGSVYGAQLRITPGRHSRMFLAGIQEKILDARSRPKDCGDKLRGHDG